MIVKELILWLGFKECVALARWDMGEEEKTFQMEATTRSKAKSELQVKYKLRKL